MAPPVESLRTALARPAANPHHPTERLMPDWNPNLYLKFERERTQPVRDLVARIELPNPERILDLGCGPGNSTGVLKHRWPAAAIIGLDSSAAMIQKAKNSGLAVEWLMADAGSDLSRLGKFDVVVANASLQWLPAHEQLLTRLYQSVKTGGALAVQIPKFPDMPIAQSIAEVTRLPQYAALFAGFESGMHYFGDRFY